MLDNLVHIAHNVKIGQGCIIAAMTGISGSTKIGNNVSIGAFNVIEDDVTIGDNVKIGNFNTISEFTEIGNDCQIIHNSSIGAIPQDKKFGGETSKLIIKNFDEEVKYFYQVCPKEMLNKLENPISENKDIKAS